MSADTPARITDAAEARAAADDRAHPALGAREECEFCGSTHGRAVAEEPRLVPMTKRDGDARPLRALQEAPTGGRLYAAIGDARDRADIVLKGSKARVTSKDGSKSFEYDYASAEAKTAVARDALRGSGVVVLPLDWRIHVGTSFAMLDRIYRVAHPSGEFLDLELLDWPVLPGSGGREHDKALAVALTSSYGYFLRELCMLPSLPQDDMNARKWSGKPADAERQDTTPAEAVAESITARARTVLQRIAGIHEPGKAALCATWWKLESAPSEDENARPRYTDADLKAVDEALADLAARVAAPAAAAPDAPAPDPVDEPMTVDAAPVSPPGAKVPAPKAAAPARPRAAGRNLPGMA